MMRRVISLLLILILLFFLVACSKTTDAGGDVISPVPKGGKAELTILTHASEYGDLTQTAYIRQYIKSFERDFGVDIKIVKIGKEINSMYHLEEENEYIKKLSTKLYPKDGPELIFAVNMHMDDLIKQGAVADLRGKVANLDKVYGSLLGEKACYAPLGILYIPKILNKDALAELGVAEPGLDWTSRDYLEIRDKWVSENKPIFTAIEYGLAYGQFFNYRSFYNEKENKIILNTPEIRQKINDARNYIFGGRFQLINGYKYENYYNMIFEEASKESDLSWENSDRNMSHSHVDKGIGANIFKAKDINDKNIENGTVMYPKFKDKEAYINSYGFLVNRNGKNLNLAYEFINGLLTDEIQMSMFKDKEFFNGAKSIGSFYPVNKEIEEDILKQEAGYKLDPKATELKAIALRELKDGEYKLAITADGRANGILLEIYKDFAKFILADEPYSDEQLQVELKRMEDKYNIYLNE